MDFFRKQVEAAQAQARLAASTAGKLAEQLTDQTKVLAEQASTFGKATAEQVGSTLPDKLNTSGPHLQNSRFGGQPATLLAMPYQH